MKYFFFFIAVSIVFPMTAFGSPKKVILIYEARDYVHESIPFGIQTLTRMGQTSQAFTVTKTFGDLDLLEDGDLKDCDGLIFLNTSGEIFENRPEKLRAILAFVKSGKGLVAFHSALAGSHKTPEFLELLGAEMDHHPWYAEDAVNVFADDPFHPLTAMIGGKLIKLQEEIYQFKKPYSREDLKVLLRANQTQTPPSEKKKKLREDGDYAVSWIKPYGNGRVFVTALGHNNDIYTHPLLAKHFAAGIDYAVGNLSVDMKSSAAVPFAINDANFAKSHLIMKEYLRHTPYPPNHLEALGAFVLKNAKADTDRWWPWLSLLRAHKNILGKTDAQWFKTWDAPPAKKFSADIFPSKAKPANPTPASGIDTFKEDFFKLPIRGKIAATEKLVASRDTRSLPLAMTVMSTEQPDYYLRLIQAGVAKDKGFELRHRLSAPQLPAKGLSALKDTIASKDIDSGESPWIYSSRTGQWLRVASFGGNAARMMDGDPQTRWSSNRLQTQGDFIRIDLGKEKTISKLRMDSRSSPGEYARHIRVVVAGENAVPITVYEGDGEPLFELSVKKVKGRWITIEIADSVAALWSVHELEAGD